MTLVSKSKKRDIYIDVDLLAIYGIYLSVYMYMHISSRV